MGRILNAFKAGLQGTEESSTGEHFTVAGKEVVCPHCGHDRFEEGRALLNTAGMTFLKLDWANRSAATLLCTRCGHIAWFLQDPESTQ